MKRNYIRIAVITAINIFFTYLLFGPLNWGRYIYSENLYIWGIYATIGSLIPTILTLLFFKFVDKKGIKTLGFRFSSKDAMFFIAIFILMSSISLALIWFVSKATQIPVHWNLAILSDVTFYFKLFCVLIGWFFAAFYEEILYRGYFVANLRSLSKGKLYVIISIIFMLSHVFKGLDPIYAVILMIMSMAFIYVYLSSGSILPITLAHMTYNFITPHLIGTSDISILVVDMEKQPFSVLYIIVLFLVLFVSLSKLFYRKKEDFIEIPYPKSESVN